MAALTVESLRIAAPAKLNLFLHVTGRRRDGYHDLLSLMCCIDLCDQLTLHLDKTRDGMQCDHPQLPCDVNNLVIRAQNAFNVALRRETVFKPRPVWIRLAKKIPLGAGLGGGSSDAAAVLRALNTLYGSPLDDNQLARLALTLGADVPFFIKQTPAIATGVGECLTPYAHALPWHVLLVYPGFGVKTAEIFRDPNLRLTKHEKKLSYFAFNNGKLDLVAHMANDLEEPVIRRFPVIAAIKAALHAQGALGALMTGSGSSVFGLFADAASLQRAVRNLAPQPGWRVFTARLRTDSAIAVSPWGNHPC